MGFRIPSIGLALRWRFRFRRWSYEIPAHVSDTRAGWRWRKAGGHRLHGVEGSRQRAQSAAYFQIARQGTAARRIPDATQKSRQARLRILGRLRSELRRPTHSFRAYELLGLFVPGFGREFEYPHLRHR